MRLSEISRLQFATTQFAQRLLSPQVQVQAVSAQSGFAGLVDERRGVQLAGTGLYL